MFLFNYLLNIIIIIILSIAMLLDFILIVIFEFRIPKLLELLSDFHIEDLNDYFDRKKIIKSIKKLIK